MIWLAAYFAPSKAQVLFILKNFYSKYPFPSQPQLAEPVIPDEAVEGGRDPESSESSV